MVVQNGGLLAVVPLHIKISLLLVARVRSAVQVGSRQVLQRVHEIAHFDYRSVVIVLDNRIIDHPVPNVDGIGEYELESTYRRDRIPQHCGLPIFIESGGVLDLFRAISGDKWQFGNFRGKWREEYRSALDFLKQRARIRR